MQGSCRAASTMTYRLQVRVAAPRRGCGWVRGVPYPFSRAHTHTHTEKERKGKESEGHPVGSHLIRNPCTGCGGGKCRGKKKRDSEVCWAAIATGTCFNYIPQPPLAGTALHQPASYPRRRRKRDLLDDLHRRTSRRTRREGEHVMIRGAPRSTSRTGEGIGERDVFTLAREAHVWPPTERLEAYTQVVGTCALGADSSYRGTPFGVGERARGGQTRRKSSSVQVEAFRNVLGRSNRYANRYFQIPPEPHGGYREHNKPFFIIGIITPSSSRC